MEFGQRKGSGGGGDNVNFNVYSALARLEVRTQ